MAITKLSIDEFLQLSKEYPVLDVRSPGEFSHAHIPGAFNLPLFSDEERKIVGTAYKQESQKKAIKLGLDFFGVKMAKMVEEAEKIVDGWQMTDDRKQANYQLSSDNSILVHCWRGGMRSAGVAWLLDLYGFKVYTLVGGYKAYRKWVLQQFEKEYRNIHILSGYTGSGKTETLHALAQKELYIVDLEKLANHKGSAFGNLGQPPQPSQEMFENLLAKELRMIVDRWQMAGKNGPDNYQLSSINSPMIWIEDESQRIGEVNIPTAFFKQMRDKQFYFVNIPFEARLDFIVQHYGKFEKEKLVNNIIRIKKRLGGLETKTAINCLLEDDIRGCFSVLLTYYDKYYLKSLRNRENFSSLFNQTDLSIVSAEETAEKLLAAFVKNVTV